MDEGAFERLVASRPPIWAPLRRDDQRYDVYLLSDRGGIYGLGFPVVTLLGHMMNLAELTVIGAVTFLAILVLAALFNTAARRATSAPALLREIRASFYRKLFIAFVAAAVLPVIALALVTRNYVAAQMRANVEQEA